MEILFRVFLHILLFPLKVTYFPIFLLAITETGEKAKFFREIPLHMQDLAMPITSTHGYILPRLCTVALYFI